MKPTRVAELEKRLEDLTSRLDTVSRQPPTPPDSTDTATSPSPVQCIHEHSKKWKGRFMFSHLFPNEIPAEIPANAATSIVRQAIHPDTFFLGSSREENQPDRASLTNSDENATVDSPEPQTPRPGKQQPPSQEAPWPDPPEAEQLLAQALAYMMPLFPFIVIPASVTATELRQSRPFLWKALMMGACYYDGSRQMLLGNILVREVTEAAVMKPQKTLDLLLGLQILLAW